MKNALKWLIRLIVTVAIIALIVSFFSGVYLKFGGCETDCKNQLAATWLFYTGLMIGIPSLILVFLAKVFGRHS